jgi:hypothetical protein
MNKSEMKQAIESIRAVVLGMYLNLVALKYTNISEEQAIEMINDSDIGRQYIFKMTEMLGDEMGIDSSKLPTAQELFDEAGRKNKKAEAEVAELNKLFEM